MSYGIAFETEAAVWVSEGESGRVRLIDTKSGDHRKIVDLNQGQWRNSFTGDLAFDADSHILYIVDLTNNRVAVVDSRKGQLLSSVPLGRPLFAICLSPDGSTAYVSGATGVNVGVIDIRSPRKASLQQWIVSEESSEGGDLNEGAGILAAGDRIYVSNRRQDSITVISAETHKMIAKIPLRIKSLEVFRGIGPSGMAFDPLTRWLLVAETGINAVGVIDTAKNELIGHIPTGWAPKRIVMDADRVFVTNNQGRGTGPNLRRPLVNYGETPTLNRGAVSTFVMPLASELARLTRTVYVTNGLAGTAGGVGHLGVPDGLKRVVLIMTGAGSFDELLGDIREANNPQNRRVQAVPQLARFGMHGMADGQRQHLSIKDVAITPDQHAIAQRWAFGDNFYTDLDGSATVGSCQVICSHLEHYGVSNREPLGDEFIEELKAGKQPPAFLFIHLPGATGTPQEDSSLYPYPVSYVARNDFAIGRILQYLSHTESWRETVVFIVPESVATGLDHIDSHRTMLLAAGPWIRSNYVTHVNSDFAGLCKTIFAILKVPPPSLQVATARGLNDIFTTEPDYSPFEVLPEDTRIFDPNAALDKRR